jgi:hypothetical protein
METRVGAGALQGGSEGLDRAERAYGPAGVGPPTWLAGHGWTPGQVTTITELGSRHRRRPARARAGQ